MFSCVLFYFVDAFSTHSHIMHGERIRTSLGSTTSQGFDVQSSRSSTKDAGQRPLHQNWWPVITVAALDKTRPNAIELLNKRLVIWRAGDEEDNDDVSGGWSCLDDMCSHRFAPLSEGRIVENNSGGSAACSNSGASKNCLQCAYHGWQFDNDGSTLLVPQAPRKNASPVKSYPVRKALGILWVWSDTNPESFPLAESIQLPSSPLLERYVKCNGDSWFMRDLPYGMELLGENLLDLSHLPFSHHGVGGLNREDDKYITIRKLSYNEREQNARKETLATTLVHTDEDGVGVMKGLSYVTPLIQGEVEDAFQMDPTFIGMKNIPAMGITTEASTTVAFYDPFHVRYHRNPTADTGRAFNVELFMCPTATGKSRVFLINASEMFLPISQPEHKEEGFIRKKLSTLKQLKPSALKARLMTKVISSKFGGWRGHMVSHAIFDGDGIFLHKQGDRMAREALTYKDYCTPSSADVLVNSYRRWLQSCAKKTLDCDDISFEEKENLVNAATATSSTYDDNLPRSQMLDRYHSHTKHCKVCTTALKKFERKREMMSVANIAMIGASGASGILTASLTVLSMYGMGLGRPLLRVFGLSFLGSLAAVYGTQKEKLKLQKLIQQFYFEDYIHAEKD